ncbi:gas vesicle protein [Halococcus sp. IIIV-5B]|uniref:gas vesicle protein GvpO n=1 Tax=Halococcus sp. IIIV-5B TaxID=2321230 RepID=UPI000E72D704|nr:gas vesicle protein [Halococcus sp. IIIV-5B]RJS97101.1 gas vesicle protein [Halococcus sp. IIIV-5B]
MADLDPSEHTIDELRDELESIDDPDTLEAIRESESENENRTGALDAIDERLDAVEDDDDDDDASGSSDADGTDVSGNVSAGIVEVRNHVRDAAADLIGRPLDSIVEIERDGDGDDWRALVEIVERRSVPDTQDILGRYAIQLDGGGTITGYRRLDRYRRGDTRRDEEPSQAL